MTISKNKTKELISEYGKSADDSGSTESQISIFSERISNLTGHLKVNKKDKKRTKGKKKEGKKGDKGTDIDELIEKIEEAGDINESKAKIIQKAKKKVRV